MSCRCGEKGIDLTGLFRCRLKPPREMIMNPNCFCMNVAFRLERNELDLVWIVSPAGLAVCGLEVLRRQLCLGEDRDPQRLAALHDCVRTLRRSWVVSGIHLEPSAGAYRVWLTRDPRTASTPHAPGRSSQPWP